MPFRRASTRTVRRSVIRLATYRREQSNIDGVVASWPGRKTSARGHARTHRGDRKQLRSLTPCPRSATEPVLVRLRHLAVAAATRRVLRRCVAPSPRDHDHRLIAGHSGRSCPVGDCRWSATQTRLLGTPQGAGERPRRSSDGYAATARCSRSGAQPRSGRRS